MAEHRDDGTLRSFQSGATRDTKEGKLDYEGFIDPLVLEQYARYMHMNRLQSDGQIRDSSNWQKGIPLDAYMSSTARHFIDMWKEHRGHETPNGMMANLCGMLFNVMGYMHELLKNQPQQRFDTDEPTPEMQDRLDKIKGGMSEGEKNHLKEKFLDCVRSLSPEQCRIDWYGDPEDTDEPDKDYLYPECKPGCEYSCTDPCPADETYTKCDCGKCGVCWEESYMSHKPDHDRCSDEYTYLPDSDMWTDLYNHGSLVRKGKSSGDSPNLGKYKQGQDYEFPTEGKGGTPAHLTPAEDPDKCKGCYHVEKDSDSWPCNECTKIRNEGRNYYLITRPFWV